MISSSSQRKHLCPPACFEGIPAPCPWEGVSASISLCPVHPYAFLTTGYELLSWRSHMTSKSLGHCVYWFSLCLCPPGPQSCSHCQSCPLNGNLLLLGSLVPERTEFFLLPCLASYLCLWDFCKDSCSSLFTPTSHLLLSTPVATVEPTSASCSQLFTW